MKRKGMFGEPFGGMVVLLVCGLTAVARGGAAGDSPKPAVSAAVALQQDGSVDQDPWEPFNVKTFWFNRQLDLYVLKPVAKGWDWVLPDRVQKSVSNVFDNVEMPKRLVNNVLQLKIARAGLELTRFTINSTIGVGGLLDPAKDLFGIEKNDEDTGQTFGFYGIGPGPYLVLPFVSPVTVRDGIGLVFDTALSPLSYLVPFGVIKIGERMGITATDVTNDRSLNLEFYQNVEEAAIDLYSAVRNAYLQKREAAIKQ